MKSRLTLVLLIVLVVLLFWSSKQVVAECPEEWMTEMGSCYKFIFYPPKKLFAAQSECDKFGAALVSVNTDSENSFIVSYLGQNDMKRESWHTSGMFIKKDTFQWMGDGKKISPTEQFWIKGAKSNGTEMYIAYAFVNNQYGWLRGNELIKRSYICEIKEAESYRIYQMKRNIDFGLNVDDVNDLPRGPKMVKEPMDALVIKEPNIAFLECSAFGNPPPSYRWYQNTTEITTAQNSKYTLTNGRFSITKPKAGEDDAYYHCLAENKFGKILSRKAMFTFGELGDFNNIEQDGVTAGEHEGTYLSCIAPPYKPAIRHQWSKKNPKLFIRTKENYFMFISRNGKLYFSEVSKDDAGSYYCIISLISSRDSQVFSSTQAQSITSKAIQLTVNIQSGGNVNPTIQSDFPAVFPAQPLEGDKVYIECFAYGTYTIYYSWSRKGHPFPRKAMFKDHYRVLILPNIEMEDTGTYVCTVRSNYGTESKPITLNIGAKPHFTTKLRDQMVDKGAQLTWRCEVHGKPAPTYTWFKNAIPLTPTPGKIMINSNVLTITRLSSDDDGMYQCRATNIYGSVFGGGQLKAFELMPTFVKNPLPTSTMSSQSGNVTLQCRPEAAPFPTIEWSKNGQSLGLSAGSRNGRYFFLHNGDLIIEDVQRSDTGIYRCDAKNDLGSAFTQTKLVITTGTVISLRPRPTSVIYNETAVLKCQASYSKDLDAIYTWSFNGHAIDLEKNPVYAGGDGIYNPGDLYIRNAMFQQKGRYECTVKTIVDSASGSAYLTVVGPPGEPLGVKGLKIPNQKDSLVLSWIAGPDNGQPITYYIVEYMSNYNKTWLILGSEIPNSQIQSDSLTNHLRSIVHGLSPATSYNFRMRAINRYGAGERSRPTDKIQMLSDRPTKFPEEVGGGGGKVRTLVITWKPMEPQDYNGEGFGYTIYWRKKEVKSDNIWLAKNVSVYLTQFVTIVDKDDFYLEFEVKVQGRNNLGPGPNSTIVTIYAAEDLPAITVPNVLGYAYNSTAVVVTWGPVMQDRKSLRGKLLGYKIKYWLRSINESRAIEAIYYGQAQEHIVIGLLPFTYYIFRMLVFNSAGFGPVSDEYPIKTFQPSPQAYPTEVYVLPDGDSSCKVSFRGVSTKSNEEPLQGYMVRYWRATDNIREAQNTDFGRQVSGVINGLEKGVVYYLRVLGYSRGGDGTMSSPVTLFTITKDGQVRRDMYDPMRTRALLAGSSHITPTLAVGFISLVFGQLISLYIH